MSGPGRRGLLAACCAAAVLAAGCGSAAAGQQAASGYAARYAEAPPMLVQCGFDRGAVRPGGPQPWYHLGQVLAFTGPHAGRHRAQFSSWWAASGAAQAVAGKTLAAWRTWAARHGRLPGAVCGSFAPAASLHRQIFPGQPSPWRS
ncbi:MAG TPA: hypothetical protein VH637_17170 [Streptosporangiaceae bacterium]